MMVFKCWVPGVPHPKGSLVPMRRGDKLVVVPSNQKRLRPWVEFMEAQLRFARGSRPEIDRPVDVGLTFRLPMPASRSKLERDRGISWSTVPPDIDKLVRAVLDACTTSRIWCDDSRVASLQATKVEVVDNPGVLIVVRDLPPIEQAFPNESGSLGV